MHGCGSASWSPLALDVDASRGLADLEDVNQRRELEKVHAKLLVRLGMAHIDLSEARSKVRPLSQAIRRTTYDDGYAGVVFRSKLDSGLCVALFEERARLLPTGDAERLTPSHPDLVAVCEEFDLVPRRGALPALTVRGSRGSSLVVAVLRLLGWI